MDVYLPIAGSSTSGGTKLFGHAAVVQTAMERECEMVALGYDWEYMNDEAVLEEIKKDQDEWILLFQLDSERAANMLWGDVGRLFFWIKKRDLKANRFDKTWMILQCG